MVIANVGMSGSIIVDLQSGRCGVGVHRRPRRKPGQYEGRLIGQSGGTLHQPRVAGTRSPGWCAARCGTPRSFPAPSPCTRCPQVPARGARPPAPVALGEPVLALPLAEVRQVQAMGADVRVNIRRKRRGHRLHQSRGSDAEPESGTRSLTAWAFWLEPPVGAQAGQEPRAPRRASRSDQSATWDASPARCASPGFPASRPSGWRPSWLPAGTA